MTTTDNPASVPSSPEGVRDVVRQSYGRVAAKAGASCCCGPAPDHRAHAERIGYSAEDVEGDINEANLGLGCGNPTAMAALKPGEVVIDLGSGAGFDAFIAAKKVGPEGRVIGVDMTGEMLEKARNHAVKLGVSRFVEFREGIIEDLPVASDSADVIISNCVINLSPDKPAVFREAFRVLKPGGRIAVSDILLTEALPEDVANLAAAYSACIGGALLVDDYFGAIEAAGFVDPNWTRTPAPNLFEGDCCDPVSANALQILGAERVKAIAGTVFSYRIEAKKP